MNYRFNGNEKDKFNPEIDGLFEVKSPIHGKFQKSELWDYDEKSTTYTGCLCFGLHWSVSQNETSFFSGDGIGLGVLFENPFTLLILNDSVCEGKKYERLENWFPEKVYPKSPSTFFDFKMMLQDFLLFIDNEIEAKEIEFSQKCSLKNEVKSIQQNSNEDDDLPF